MRAGHGVRADIATEVDPAPPQSVEHPRLHRTNVGDRRVRIDLETVHHKIRNGARRYGYHDQANVDRHGRIDRAGTQASGDSGVADLVVTKVHRVTGR